MNQTMMLVLSHQNMLKASLKSQLFYQCAKCASTAPSSAPVSKGTQQNPSSIPPASTSTSLLPAKWSEKEDKLQSQKSENTSISTKHEPENKIAYGRVPGTKRNTLILRMDPAEYAHTGVGKKQLSLLERRGEAQSVFNRIIPDTKNKHIDVLATIQADIDLRPIALKRIWRRVEEAHEIRMQEYKPERNRALGNELAAAHFIVFRRGKVKFLHQSDWVTKYRVDAQGDEDERDLAPLTDDVCTMPRKYNPNYRVEAIDCSGVKLLYNGLANFEGLSHVNWLSFRNADRRFDDWCLDRVYRQFQDSLEFLDLSDCPGVSERGIAGAWRLKYLKTLVVENLPHIKNLDVVCALLEEKLPGLTCVGVDYKTKIHELQEENRLIDRKERELEAELDAITIDVTSATEFSHAPPARIEKH